MYQFPFNVFSHVETLTPKTWRKKNHTDYIPKVCSKFVFQIKSP